mmetsp:Transcript_13551/g.45213  ORF Transcript_13551/g.45213 Transcript_13551/m.45213 type:complete len:244 (+) Transcript_13551:623-1354(+)
MRGRPSSRPRSARFRWKASLAAVWRGSASPARNTSPPLPPPLRNCQRRPPPSSAAAIAWACSWATRDPRIRFAPRTSDRSRSLGYQQPPHRRSRTQVPPPIDRTALRAPTPRVWVALPASPPRARTPLPPPTPRARTALPPVAARTETLAMTPREIESATAAASRQTRPAVPPKLGPRRISPRLEGPLMETPRDQILPQSPPKALQQPLARGWTPKLGGRGASSGQHPSAVHPLLTGAAVQRR